MEDFTILLKMGQQGKVSYRYWNRKMNEKFVAPRKKKYKKIH